MKQYTVPSAIVYDREEYSELVFEEPVDLEDEQFIEAANRELAQEYGDKAEIDWRDPYTVWIWYR
jgi:hypothetical protein